MRVDLTLLGFQARFAVDSTRFESLLDLLAAARTPSPAPGSPAGPDAAAEASSTPAGTPDEAVLEARLGEAPLAPPPAPARRVGRRLRAEPGRAWLLTPGDTPGLSLLVEREPGGLPVRVTGSYRQNRLVELARARYKRMPVRSIHQNLLYFLVFFPAILVAEERGGVALHGAGVRARGRTWVFSGLGGSGKTSLALALFADAETRLVADNIVLADGTGVWGVPELIRCDRATRALLTPAIVSRLDAIDHGAEHGRTFFRVPGLGGRVPRVDAVVHVELGPAFELRAMTAVECARRQLALDRLALEMVAYDQYVAGLALGGLTTLSPDEREGRLEDLLAETTCVRLTVPAGRPLSEVVDRLDRELR